MIQSRNRLRLTPRWVCAASIVSDLRACHSVSGWGSDLGWRRKNRLRSSNLKYLSACSFRLVTLIRFWISVDFLASSRIRWLARISVWSGHTNSQQSSVSVTLQLLSTQLIEDHSSVSWRPMACSKNSFVSLRATTSRREPVCVLMVRSRRRLRWRLVCCKDVPYALPSSTTHRLLLQQSLSGLHWSCGWSEC